MTIEGLTIEDKAEIDALSHEEMCRMWRFGTRKAEWKDGAHPAGRYFTERLWNHFGGFTPEISKSIGWQ
jgi:hypothetical protein